jgi:monoamine oxidase
MRNPSSAVPPSGPIVVAGAGFAGLTAAFRLFTGGVPTIVVEARDRVGGRVHTTRLPNGEPAELGAEWIEDDAEALPALASELGLALAETGVDYRRRQGVGPLGASIDLQEEALAVARRALSERGAGVGGESLGGFLRSLPLGDAQRATLIARLQGTCALDLDRVPLRVAERGTFEGRGDRYFRVDAGNQAIAEAMASALPDVRLRHVVERIRVDDDGVHVEGESPSGPFSLAGPAAIVALPAPLAAPLRFEPALDADVRRALDELPMGVASKLAIATAEVPPLRALQEVTVPFWCWTARDGRGPRRVLTAFAGSAEAQTNLDVAAGDPGPWLERVAPLFPDVRVEGEPLLRTWGDDPFARGCYACFDEASWERRPLFERPAHGRIAFAGEHTAGLASGTMDGAVQSGNRAAAWVRDLLATAQV